MRFLSNILQFVLSLLILHNCTCALLDLGVGFGFGIVFDTLPPTTDRPRIDPDRIRSEEQKEGLIRIRSHRIPSPTTTPPHRPPLEGGVVSIVRLDFDSDVSVLSRRSISVGEEADLLGRMFDSQYDRCGGVPIMTMKSNKTRRGRGMCWRQRWEGQPCWR